MALVARQVDCALPCPSPVRVGSRGKIHYLMEKERPNDPQSLVYRSRYTKEFANVCREVVSVSCGQPLLSYKPKRSKPSKVAKTIDSKSANGSERQLSLSRTPSSTTSAAIRQIVDQDGSLEASLKRRGLPKSALRVKGVSGGPVRRSFSHGDAYDFERKCSLEEEAFRKDGPSLQRSASHDPKLATDDYHKALIPFLRSEWDAAAKVLRRRQCNTLAMRNVHRRATSLGNASCGNLLCKEGISGGCDQKVWDSCTSSASTATRKHSYLRLSATGNL